jgi:hypothetical protein
MATTCPNPMRLTCFEAFGLSIQIVLTVFETPKVILKATRVSCRKNDEGYPVERNIDLYFRMTFIQFRLAGELSLVSRGNLR